MMLCMETLLLSWDFIIFVKHAAALASSAILWAVLLLLW